MSGGGEEAQAPEGEKGGVLPWVTRKGHRSDLGSQIRVPTAPYKAGLAGTKFLDAGWGGGGGVRFHWLPGRS